MVQPGQYLQFKVGADQAGISNRNPVVINTNARTGLSAGSGTVELVALSETSLETPLDVVCWQRDTLSQPEAARVLKWQHSGDWQGDCIDIPYAKYHLCSRIQMLLTDGVIQHLLLQCIPTRLLITFR